MSKRKYYSKEDNPNVTTELIITYGDYIVTKKSKLSTENNVDKRAGTKHKNVNIIKKRLSSDDTTEKSTRKNRLKKKNTPSSNHSSINENSNKSIGGKELNKHAVLNDKIHMAKSSASNENKKYRELLKSKPNDENIKIRSRTSNKPHRNYINANEKNNTDRAPLKSKSSFDNNIKLNEGYSKKNKDVKPKKSNTDTECEFTKILKRATVKSKPVSDLKRCRKGDDKIRCTDKLKQYSHVKTNRQNISNDAKKEKRKQSKIINEKCNLETDNKHKSKNRSNAKPIPNKKTGDKDKIRWPKSSDESTENQNHSRTIYEPDTKNKDSGLKIGIKNAENCKEKEEKTKLSNKSKILHKPKQINLILNLHISHSSNSIQNTSCSETIDDKIASVSNSEINFLDDINVDEILFSLQNNDNIMKATEGELGKSDEVANNSHTSVNNLAGKDKQQININSNKNNHLDGIQEIIIIDNELPGTENSSKCKNSTSNLHFKNQNNLRQQRDDESFGNVTKLPENNKKEDKNKDAPVYIHIDDDDSAEILSDHYDVIEISDSSDTEEKSKELETIKNTTNQKCSIDQSQKISAIDSIEEQLLRIFGMDTSSPSTLNSGVEKNTVIEREKAEKAASNVSKKETEITLPLTQDRFVPQDVHSEVEKEINIAKTTTSKCNESNPKEDTEIKKDVQVVEKLTNATTVKSEIITVSDSQHPKSSEKKTFAKILKNRMLNVLKEEYTVKSLVHKGRFSRIYQCKDKDGSDYAVKVLRNVRDRYFLGVDKEAMLINIQKDIPREKLNCVHLVRGFSISGYWCFLMEYFPRNLYQALWAKHKPFHIDTVQALSKQLIMAVLVLRNKNIVHADITPNHILINNTNDRLKLCGFDKAYYIQDAVIAPNIGSLNYRAPEVILGHSAGYSLDVWSAALVMFEMATKTALFSGFDNNDTLFKQMCTIGCVPNEMLMNSRYSHHHFYSRRFMRRVEYSEAPVKFISYFKKSKRMHRKIYDVYEKHWRKNRTEEQQDEDMAKLSSFINLLEQMLVMYPKYRLTIEFAYANPFIYK